MIPGALGARARTAGLIGVVLLAAAFTPGCYTTQLGLLRSGMDSLRVQIDTLTVRDSVTYLVLADTRRELGQQRDLMLSTRANSGSTMQEMFDQMSKLEGKLDEVMHRFTSIAERANPAAPPAAAPSAGAEGADSSHAAAGAPPAGAPAHTGGAAPTANDVYDQATRDLTEGRYPLALQGYREFLRRFPSAELADDAQYGIGECFFAQAAFDSAATEYARVGSGWPQSPRLPAALYKLGLSQDRLGRTADARKTFDDLARRFPASSEAALARERAAGGKH